MKKLYHKTISCLGHKLERALDSYAECCSKNEILLQITLRSMATFLTLVSRFTKTIKIKVISDREYKIFIDKTEDLFIMFRPRKILGKWKDLQLEELPTQMIQKIGQVLDKVDGPEAEKLLKKIVRMRAFL